jgi:hypothetical protein
MTEPPGAVACRVEAFVTRIKRAIGYFENVIGPDHALIGHEVMAAELSRVLDAIEFRTGRVHLSRIHSRSPRADFEFFYRCAESLWQPNSEHSEQQH